LISLSSGRVLVRAVFLGEYWECPRFRSVVADLLLRQEPDEEEDEGDGKDKEDVDDDDTTDDGYSE